MCVNVRPGFRRRFVDMSELYGICTIPPLSYKSSTADSVSAHRVCVWIQVRTVTQHTLGLNKRMLGTVISPHGFD